MTKRHTKIFRLQEFVKQNRVACPEPVIELQRKLAMEDITSRHEHKRTENVCGAYINILS